MAKYHHIKRKLKRIKNTKKITKAMELVAGSKLRRAQERLERIRRYQQKLQEMVQFASGSMDELSHPLVQGRPVKTRGLVVAGADRGLCGAYNSSLLRLAQKWIEEGDIPVKVIVIGRRPRDYFRRQNLDLMEYYPQPAEELSLETVRPIGNRILQAYFEQEVDSIHLVYARFRSALINIPTLVQLVPVERKEAEEGTSGDLIFEPDPQLMFEHLLPRVITTELIGYLAESMTSEHGARMVAMQNATKNAEELIDWLTLQFNRARQTSITQDILEVVGGAEALGV